MVSSVSSPGKAVVTPAAEARIIYVSASTGDDTNDGLTPEYAVKTITRGQQLVRDQSPDWLLLKRGDRWESGLDDWHKRGRGPEQPMIIGAYGTGPRPLMKSGTANAPEQSLEFVTVIGVQFVADARLRAAAIMASRWNHGASPTPPAPGTVRRAGDPQPKSRPGHVSDDPVLIRSLRPQPGRSAYRPPEPQADPDSIDWPIQIPSREEPLPEPPAAASPRPSRVFYDIASIASAIPSPAEALRPIRNPAGPIAPQPIRLAPRLPAKDAIAVASVAPLAPLAERIAQQSNAQPLRVKRITLGNNDTSVVVVFTANIAAGVDRSDLLLESSDGTTIDSTAMAVKCDPSGRIATWTFPGMPGKVLPAGSWRVTLRGCITDNRGQQLDGLADGIGGDDFRSPHRLISQGTPLPTAQRPCIEPLPQRAAA